MDDWERRSVEVTPVSIFDFEEDSPDIDGLTRTPFLGGQNTHPIEVGIEATSRGCPGKEPGKSLSLNISREVGAAQLNRMGLGLWDSSKLRFLRTVP